MQPLVLKKFIHKYKMYKAKGASSYYIIR